MKKERDNRDKFELRKSNVESRYTAIYVESWMIGSHRETLTEMRRIELQDGETIEKMLDRECLVDKIVFLFHGHPPLQGEGV